MNKKLGFDGDVGLAGDNFGAIVSNLYDEFPLLTAGFLSTVSYKVRSSSPPAWTNNDARGGTTMMAI